APGAEPRAASAPAPALQRPPARENDHGAPTTPASPGAHRRGPRCPGSPPPPQPASAPPASTHPHATALRRFRPPAPPPLDPPSASAAQYRIHTDSRSGSSPLQRAYAMLRHREAGKTPD